MGRSVTLSERTPRLSTVLGKVGAKAVYTYDLGDRWEHELAVERVLVPNPGQPYPTCVEGQRQGPPEDRGGISGFYHLLGAIRNPEDQDHQELCEWLSLAFDSDQNNAMLRQTQLSSLNGSRVITV